VSKWNQKKTICKNDVNEKKKLAEFRKFTLTLRNKELSVTRIYFFFNWRDLNVLIHTFYYSQGYIFVISKFGGEKYDKKGNEKKGEKEKKGKKGKREKIN